MNRDEGHYVIDRAKSSAALVERDLAAKRRCETGKHTMTSTVSINQSPPVPVCSWCGHGWPVP